MTNEEIFEIAKQAGFHYPSNDCLLVPFAKLVAAREREACCATVTGLCASDNNAEEINRAIRARGQS